jgi:hypothetical protein
MYPELKNVAVVGMLLNDTAYVMKLFIHSVKT